MSICDIMLASFYPELYDTHINPIPKDGNIFNLDLLNITYVPNAYYEGDNAYKENYINIDGRNYRLYNRYKWSDF